MKLKTFIIIFSLIVFVLVISFFDKLNNEKHKKICIDDISKVTIWGTGIDIGRRDSNNEEKVKIIKWFNNIYDVKENKLHNGTTPDSGIDIQLKNGKIISIINSGKDFEIYRGDYGSPKSYWGKNKELRLLLEQSTKKNVSIP